MSSGIYSLTQTLHEKVEGQMGKREREGEAEGKRLERVSLSEAEDEKKKLCFYKLFVQCYVRCIVSAFSKSTLNKHA